jgi:hypothetical protein
MPLTIAIPFDEKRKKRIITHPPTTEKPFYRQFCCALVLFGMVFSIYKGQPMCFFSLCQRKKPHPLPIQRLNKNACQKALR